MNDDKRQAPDDSGTGPVAGERLAEARRLKQISLPDVARQLHLDEPRVQALEENRFDVLGAPVFAKGYLRKYAKLVGVPVDDVMADYYLLNRATGAPPVVGPPRDVPRDFDASRWIVALLVIIAIAAVVFWWMQRTPLDVPLLSGGGETATEAVREAERAPTTEARAGSPADTADTDLEASVPPAPALEPDEAAPAVPESAESAESAPPDAGPAGNAAPPAATGGDVTLRLAFSGECWTEITAADGRRLFFELGTAGRTVTVSGRPPLDVLIGNENNVAITVDGRPYTVAEANRRGNTARFTVRR